MKIFFSEKRGAVDAADVDRFEESKAELITEGNNKTEQIYKIVTKNIRATSSVWTRLWWGSPRPWWDFLRGIGPRKPRV